MLQTNAITYFAERHEPSETLASLGHPFACMFREAVTWLTGQAFPGRPDCGDWLIASDEDAWFATCGPRLAVDRPDRAFSPIEDLEQWRRLAGKNWADCTPRFNITLSFDPGPRGWLRDAATQLANGKSVRASGDDAVRRLYCADWREARNIICSLAAGFPPEGNLVGRIDRLRRAEAARRQAFLDEVTRDLTTPIRAPDAWL